MTSFICPPCRDYEHGQCWGGKRCDCQHRSVEPEPATGPVDE